MTFAHTERESKHSFFRPDGERTHFKTSSFSPSKPSFVKFDFFFGPGRNTGKTFVGAWITQHGANHDNDAFLRKPSSCDVSSDVKLQDLRPL
jgi:hypothetical protein